MGKKNEKGRQNQTKDVRQAEKKNPGNHSQRGEIILPEAR